MRKIDDPYWADMYDYKHLLSIWELKQLEIRNKKKKQKEEDEEAFQRELKGNIEKLSNIEKLREERQPKTPLENVALVKGQTKNRISSRTKKKERTKRQIDNDKKRKKEYKKKLPPSIISYYYIKRKKEIIEDLNTISYI